MGISLPQIFGHQLGNQHYILFSGSMLWNQWLQGLEQKCVL